MRRRTALQLLAAGVPALGWGASFQPTWESLTQYRCAGWFRDAKFGIWAHWGPQCVPEQGDWYARNLYIEGHEQNLYHVKTYDHPSKFGYKDIIPLWKAERFDPEDLIRKYKRAGARYFVAMGVHHDNYDCWNSRHHRWNAVKVGPKKDIVGLWSKAARKHGLRFGVTEHLERSYSWFNVNKGSDKKGPYAGVPYDGNDPKYRDLYFEPHEDTSPQFPLNPPESWMRTWQSRIIDLVDSYQPDLLYTDGGIPFGEIGREMVAHYYNANQAWHQGNLEAVYAIKNVKDGRHGEYREGVAVLDLERGVVDDIRAEPWQTDTCLGNWYYKRGLRYKTAETVIHMLCDIVSKNGNLLLNFPLQPDGTLDPEEERIREGLEKWIAVNGEAIYATRPWKVFGEGPTKAGGGQFSERNAKQFTAEDIRFTAKGDLLYAICLGWPQAQLRIKSLATGNLWPGGISSVRLLGGDSLKFSRGSEGLTVQMPDRKPGDFAFALEVTRG